MGRKRFCSLKCRQNLRQKLDLRTGLLQALNTRYATFYFTDRLINLDILPYGTKNICSFVARRTPGKKPGEDFGRMANILGELWWTEHYRTKKRYVASRHVLDSALPDRVSLASVKPPVVYMPSISPASLVYLNLEKGILSSPEKRKGIIKDAYRRQAKIHHPDSGGDAVIFRKVHKAYQDLMQWAEKPNFTFRRGFPDKWVYEGEKNRWVMPVAAIRPRGR
ncbi:MAG: J domain-containing protein [Deltaproteobacteria bacterium]|nr:J domain-containing protein [Deltaproteobacteria bacterium]